jgi:hypothetical protein
VTPRDDRGGLPSHAAESRFHTSSVFGMDHLHYQWLEDVSADLQREYDRIQEGLKEGPENIQLSGHQAEATWCELLTDWLPPGYSFGVRKYLLFEHEVDGQYRSGETDLVLFHPAYPERLRQRKEVMIGGVIAAFSVKLKLNRAGLREAMDEAAVLRRGLGIRPGALIGELVSPLITGVLAQSHALGANPQDTVGKILREDKSTRMSHPRDELDLVCVADLNYWVRDSTILRAGVPHSFAKDGDEYLPTWQSGRLAGATTEVRPIAGLVTHLWQKLARRDVSLTPIADSFRHTGTSGSYEGRGESQPLATLISPGAYASIQWRGDSPIHFVD